MYEVYILNLLKEKIGQILMQLLTASINTTVVKTGDDKVREIIKQANITKLIQKIFENHSD